MQACSQQCANNRTDGASLIYTAPSAPSQLQTLAHSSLGIHSLLKKQPLKPNVIDRDKVVVPPNWDSWGKIRVLREGFDVEAVSEGWSIDLETKFPPPGRNAENAASAAANGVEYDTDGYEITPGSAVTMYEDSIRNPTHDALHMAGRDTHSTTLEVETQDTQLFLEARNKQLEAHKQKMEEEDRAGAKAQLKDKRTREAEQDDKTANVSDHIGPVQFNVGGIQVDADDMMKRLQVRIGRRRRNTFKSLTNPRIVKHTLHRLSQKVQLKKHQTNSSPLILKTCRIFSRI